MHLHVLMTDVLHFLLLLSCCFARVENAKRDLKKAEITTEDGVSPSVTSSAVVQSDAKVCKLYASALCMSILYYDDTAAATC